MSTPTKATALEYRAALGVADTETWWLAVHAAIETQRAEAHAEMEDVSNQKHPHLLHYYSGLAQGMKTLADYLREERARALKEPEDE